jgi:hypothetical protein
MSKEYLNESFINRSARTILFNIYLRLINETSLLKRNDHFFDYFKFIFISQLFSDLVIIFFRCNHESIFFVFENFSTYRVRDNFFAVNFGVNELLAEFRGTLSIKYINKRIYS